MDAESELITAIAVLPANGDEGANATKLVQQEEQAQGNDIEAMSIDSIGYRGDLLDQWTDPEGLNLEVIVPPIEQAPAVGFPPEAFTLDAAKEKRPARRRKNGSGTPTTRVGNIGSHLGSVRDVPCGRSAWPNPRRRPVAEL